MSNNIPDDKFDLFLKGLMDDAATDDSTVDEIASSPALWWNVQRRIEAQKAAARSPWPPVKTFFRVLKYAVPAFAALTLVIGVVVFYPKPDANDAASLTSISVNEPAVTPNSFANVEAAQPEPKPENTEKTHLKAVRVRAARDSAVRRNERSAQPLTAEKTEIKSDFIALSYARDAESGQIVRVKVPSSMMVTLGLVATVEKPTALVDAEVIVGDDGLTRAIRFIH